jgi:hypothetical protein
MEVMLGGVSFHSTNLNLDFSLFGYGWFKVGK